MSLNTYRNPVEWTGGIKVHHPGKEQQAEVTEYQPWFNKEWEGVEKWHHDWNAVKEAEVTESKFWQEFDADVERTAQRLTQRGEAITFYREVGERRAA